MLVVNVKLFASLGLLQANPIYRKKAVTFESRSLAECLEQYRGDGVTRLPILYQMFCTTRKKVRGEMRNANPWQCIVFCKVVGVSLLSVDRDVDLLSTEGSITDVWSNVLKLSLIGKGDGCG